MIDNTSLRDPSKLFHISCLMSHPVPANGTIKKLKEGPNALLYHRQQNKCYPKGVYLIAHYEVTIDFSRSEFTCS